jgi:hypothetical protein
MNPSSTPGGERPEREETQGELERQLSVENVRLKRQLAEKEEELAILKKAAAYSRYTRSAVRLHEPPYPRISPHRHVPGVLGLAQRLLCWRRACPGPRMQRSLTLDWQVAAAFAARKAGVVRRP